MRETAAERSVRLLMRRLIAARKARGLSHVDAATASGLGVVTHRKLEGQWKRGVPHLRLDQVVRFARAYRVPLYDLLLGWPGDDRGRAPPVRPEPIDFPDVAELCADVCGNLRQCRENKRVGYRLAAGGAFGNPKLGPALYRLEEGLATHESLTMLKLFQLAAYYEIPVLELVLGLTTATATEDEE
jgi:transcriptional regulator with XRE-family HTH domain